MVALSPSFVVRALSRELCRFEILVLIVILILIVIELMSGSVQPSRCGSRSVEKRRSRAVKMGSTKLATKFSTKKKHTQIPEGPSFFDPHVFVHLHLRRAWRPSYVWDETFWARRRS